MRPCLVSLCSSKVVNEIGMEPMLARLQMEARKPPADTQGDELGGELSRTEFKNGQFVPYYLKWVWVTNQS